MSKNLEVLSGSSSSKLSSTSPSTPLLKRRRRMLEESPLSQSEVSWQQIDSGGGDLDSSSPQRVGMRAKSSNTLVQTPVRIVKRHVSSPSITTIKNRFGDLEKMIPESEEEVELKKGDSYDDFNFSDDQIEAVLKQVDVEEKLKKQNETKVTTSASTATLFNGINFEDSFDDAILASIPLEELSKCSKSKTSSVEILYTAGLSQIINETSPVKVMSKNKSMESVNQIASKRSLDRHSSLPQQPLTTSNNGKTCCRKH
jgi:hypothetical protein